MEARLRTASAPSASCRLLEHKALFRMEEGTLEVAAPNKVLAGLLEGRFGTLVHETRWARSAQPTSLTVAPDLFGPHAERAASARSAASVEIAAHRAGPAQGHAQERDPASRPSSRFRPEHFVVGDSNRLAYNASVQMAEHDRGGWGGERRRQVVHRALPARPVRRRQDAPAQRHRASAQGASLGATVKVTMPPRRS